MNEDTSSAHEKLRLIDLIHEAGGKLEVEAGTHIIGYKSTLSSLPSAYAYIHWSPAIIVYSIRDNIFCMSELSGSLAKCVVVAHADGTLESNGYGYREWRMKDDDKRRHKFSS